MAAPNVKPTLMALGSLLRAWTRERGTAALEAGTFNAETRPTDTEAQDLIDTAYVDTLALIGEPKEGWSDVLAQAASLLVLYRAATLVALSYMPEDADADKAADRFEQMHKDLLPNVKVLVGHFEAGETSDSPVSAPAFGFTDLFYDPLGVWQQAGPRPPGSEATFVGFGYPGYWILQGDQRIFVPVSR